MMIRLHEPLQSDILAAVNRGRYASFEDAMADAASLLIERLKQEQADELETTRRAVAEMKAGRGRPAALMLADMQRMIDKSQ